MKKIILLTIMMLVMIGCSNDDSYHEGNSGYLTIANTEIEQEINPVVSKTSLAEEDEDYSAQELLVKFKDEDIKERILLEYGLSIKKELDGLGVSLVNGAEVERLEKLAEELNQREEVEFAELNQRMRTMELTVHPTDYYYDKQWHYSAVSLPETWYKTTGSKDVTVAVLDTGIDVNHPDLNGLVIDGKNFTSDAEDDFYDRNGHGTHVAGSIGALANDQGVVGVNWEVSLLSAKVLADNGSGSNLSTAQGVKWAVDNGADIINLSLGSPFPSATVKEAIDYAYQKDVTVIAAAGNGGNDRVGDPDLKYPAQFETVISVGAVDQNLELTSFSNYGRELDFVAPGQHIYSTVPYGRYLDSYLEEVVEDEYVRLSGTSMAAPHVAGVAALILAEEPDLTPEEIKERLQRTAQDLGAEDVGRGWDFKYGYGLVNAHAAVSNAQIGRAVIFAGEKDGNQIKLKSELADVSDDGFYQLENVKAGEWHLYAWIDLTGSGKIEQGDYFGKTAHPVGAGLNVDFELELLTDEVEWEIKKH
ncbi:S8 family peptidase [Natroniella sulfidigena]|uniref:S8 family peptidase n=1 Tax=Natroniella sulfidigena TaxID=723921 RepID=UPI00200A07EE|nr:S8 family peptidase [Natroniella sulfidigena]MCK8816369.1 S8 family peptidase [Natroniella sulfidigena]